MKLNRLRRRHPAAKFASENSALLIAGAAVGAALVYLTTGRGKRHRQVVVDKTVSAVRSGADAVGATARDLGNRTRGLWRDTADVGNGSDSPRARSTASH